MNRTRQARQLRGSAISQRALQLVSLLDVAAASKRMHKSMPVSSTCEVSPPAVRNLPDHAVMSIDWKHRDGPILSCHHFMQFYSTIYDTPWHAMNSSTCIYMPFFSAKAALAAV